MKKIILSILVMLTVLVCASQELHAADTAETVATGICGSSTRWVLDSEGTLTISGTGALNYVKSYANYQDQIKHLVIEEGVTSICENAFKNYVLLSGDLVIPNTVVTIGASAFYGCEGLDGTLTLSNKLTTVGNFAFCYCENLKGDLYLPDSLKNIGNCAFSDCGFDGELRLSPNIKSMILAFGDCPNFKGDLIIPEGITQIPQGCFSNCGFDGELVIASTVNTIDREAFSNCSNLKGDLVLPESLTKVSVWAFKGCKGFTSLTIPDGVTTIAQSAFNGCTGIRGNVVIPSSVTEILDSAFANCRMTSLTILNPECTITASSSTLPSGVKLIAAAGSTTQTYARKYVRTFEELACTHEWNSEYTFIKTPTDTEPGVKAILCSMCGEVQEGSEIQTFDEAIIASGMCGENAMWELGEAGTLTISGSGSISDNSGYGAYKNKIKRLVIEYGITSIGDYAFDEYTGITGNLVIPNSVTSIGYSAFYGCKGFDGTLTLSNKLQTIGYFAFCYCENFKGDLVIPESVTIIRNCAFSDCGFDGTLTLSKNIKTMLLAFSDCTNFTGDLIIPEGITKLEQGVFSNCGFDGKLVIPETVTTIDRDAFGGCSNLTGELVLPSGLSKISTCAFEDCVGFTSVMIPSGVGVVSSYAFRGCSGLTGELVLPESVSEVETGAFTGTKLKKLTVLNPDCMIASASTTFPTTAKLCGYTDSTVHVYAKAYGRTFEEYTCSHVWDTEYKFIQAPTDEAPGIKAILCTICGEVQEGSEAESSVENIIASGTCGEYVYWELGEAGTLTISGTGAISDNTGYGLYQNQIKRLVIEDGIKYIGANAFRNYTNISGNLTLPDSVLMVEDSAFYGCTGLNGTLKLSAKLHTVGNFAFCYCENLKGDLILPEKLEKIGSSAFAHCGFDGTLQLSPKIKTMTLAFSGCSNFTGDLIIPEGITNIPQGAFQNCSGFNGKLILPESLISIELSGFEGCSGLTAIEFGKGLKTIGRAAFRNCSSVAGDIILPKGVYSVGTSAFSGCQMNKIVVLNDECVIGEDANVFSTSIKLSGYADSTVQDYAKTYNRNFIEFVCEHVYVDTVTDPTCTEAGFTTHVCDCCEESYVDSYVDATGHEMGDWTEVTAPICLESGLARRDCENCEHYEEQEEEALGHSYQSVTEEPSCTEQGYTTHICERCGDSYVDSYVNAAGHEMGDWVEVTAPTCLESGLKRRDCEKCDHYEEQEEEALGHSYQSVTVEPSCTEQGYTVHTCDRCGDSYVDSYVDAAGHQLGEWTEVTVPTCLEGGLKRRDCEKCDHYEEQEVEALGHSYQSVTEEPSCTEQGYTTHTCDRCGDSYVDSYVDAAGHQLEEWTKVTAPTCLEGGLKRRDCENCDHYEEQEVEALGHSYQSVTEEPNCTEQGYTTHTCDRCGDSYVDSYVNAAGHTYGAWKTTKAATCTTEGTKRHDCKNCDSYETEKIAKLDHSKKTTVTKATLSKNGKKVTKCTACDEVFKTVTIYKVSSVKLSYTKTTYNGKVKTPSVTVKDTKGNVLKKGTDYTVKYEDGRKSTGEYTVTIKFKGNYSGTKERTFKILPAATSKVTAASTKTTLKATWKKVTGATGYKVELLSSSGKAVKKPVYTTKLNTTFTGLTKATIYKIKVTAYKTIDGDKICSLSSKTLKTATAPDKASLKVTAGTKKATLSWSKETCSGYEIVYDTNSKFSSPDKTVTISKSSTVKTTIKNLKKGKTYYFKIRAYKLVDGMKVYSENSNVVKVKIK